MYEIFCHSILVRYKTRLFSCGTFIVIFFTASLLLPLSIHFFGREIWWLPGVYTEQPNIKFAYKAIFLLDTIDKQYTWSTFPTYNYMKIDRIKIVLLEMIEEDVNNDEIIDLLHLTLTVPSDVPLRVNSFSLFLIFDYTLKKNIQLKMQTMALISAKCPAINHKYTFHGSLEIFQKEKLYYEGNDNRYDVHILNSQSIYANNFEFVKMLNAYAARNVSTYLTRVVDIWDDANEQQANDFVVEIFVKYPIERAIKYQISFRQILKWSYVQFIFFCLVLWYLSRLFLNYIFYHRLVDHVVRTCFCGCAVNVNAPTCACI